jgi:hypothetical protein
MPDLRSRTQYRHVISLGYLCSSAMELERYGFREASYPLDWVICSIAPTLALLESGFQDFLKSDLYLRRDDLKEYVVHDLKSGVDFYHDFDEERAIGEQFEGVRDKYARRIQRWRRAMGDRTLFVRYIENLEEFEYLDDNIDAVLALLRRSHPLNDLLLVGNEDLPPNCGQLQVYRVDRDKDDTVAREFLRKSPQLRRRLRGLDYPIGLRVSNYLRYLRTRRWPKARIRLGKWLRSTLRPPVAFVLGEERAKRLLVRVRSIKSSAVVKPSSGGASRP